MQCNHTPAQQGTARQAQALSLRTNYALLGACPNMACVACLGQARGWLAGSVRLTRYTYSLHGQPMRRAYYLAGHALGVTGRG
jgi:hypothetical protein